MRSLSISKDKNMFTVESPLLTSQSFLDSTFTSPAENPKYGLMDNQL